MRKKACLIIEDDSFQRSMIRTMMQGLGLDDTEVAEEGATGLSKLRAHPGAYDLVLLDLEMPVMGGLSFLRELRQEPDDRLRDLPVVVLTGYPEKDNVVAAQQLGVTGFLTKSGLTAQGLKPYVKRALGVLDS